MKLHRLEQRQALPISLEEAWDFFSNPRNLDEITPEGVGFEITHCPEGRMYEGEIITYRVKIAPMIWVKWVTEIKAVDHLMSFVDEQRAGPYKFWHHRHCFEEIPGGVLMTDLVNYSVGMGVIGEVAHKLFVRQQLRDIFEGRRAFLAKRFGEMDFDENA